MLGLLPNTVLTAASLLLIAAGCLMVSYARGRDGERARLRCRGRRRRSRHPDPGDQAVPGHGDARCRAADLVDHRLGRPAGRTRPGAAMVDLSDRGCVPRPDQPIAVAIAAVAAGVAAFAIRRQLRSAWQAFGLVMPVSLPLALIVADVQWPAVSLAMLASASGSPSPPRWRPSPSGGGLRPARRACPMWPPVPPDACRRHRRPLLALTLVSARRRLGRLAPASVVRVIAWIFAVGFGAMAGAAVVLVAGYGRVQAAFGVLAVALVALTLAAAVRATRRDEALALAGTAHLVMVVALMLTDRLANRGHPAVRDLDGRADRADLVAGCAHCGPSIPGRARRGLGDRDLVVGARAAGRGSRRAVHPADRRRGTPARLGDPAPAAVDQAVGRVRTRGGPGRTAHRPASRRTPPTSGAGWPSVVAVAIGAVLVFWRRRSRIAPATESEETARRRAITGRRTSWIRTTAHG